ncbi:unnamed protein product [Darwinula stevensoni]|uniref:Protein kinase domain-containing protein n=1 Tax=Darwinula stevensoni TaxID=69355 RepID=A0A7R9AH66_9CRUS|nr:unnamed protein product [Darwinula stevensoni]CAG0904862.1 unnamed protein product [Darwinula stevensoni]
MYLQSQSFSELYIPKGDLMIIMEYCLGNLRDYLKMHQKLFNPNDKYYLESLSEGLTEPYCSCDLEYLTFQVSKGMEYLESRKIVHRDLAARNVLLSKNFIAKISDFGLSRNTYAKNEYIGKFGYIPYKWMALESLFDGIFTSKSDVWAFGVLVWETFSLGETPYGDAGVEVLDRIKKGYRLEAPKHAEEKHYKTMEKCWYLDPRERPTFFDLSRLLQPMLSKSQRMHYAEQYGPFSYANEEFFQVNHDLLEMTTTVEPEDENVPQLRIADPLEQNVEPDPFHVAVSDSDNPSPINCQNQENVADPRAQVDLQQWNRVEEAPSSDMANHGETRLTDPDEELKKHIQYKQWCAEPKNE